MIIAFVQTKGGTGKSTLTLNMAFSKNLHKAFPSIALVELDPQGTLQKWWNRREESGLRSDNVSFHHISDTDKDVILKELETLEEENQLLLLDVPGESIGKFHTQFACAVADMVLIPMRTSTNDEEAFEDNLLPIIEKIQEVDRQSRDAFYIVPSFTHPLANRDNITRYFKEVMPDNIRCLNATFSFGSVFENFSRGGSNLYDYLDSVKTNRKLLEQAEKAIRDIESIATEIIQMR
ncbi:MAG: ParA family protein [Proteobacteria bacterium]|nr:ParA family protein [Pseudomonadota bacterium]